MSDCLPPHGLQNPRLPCPSLSPSVCSDSCPSIHWCYLTISSSIAPFSSCPQSFQASGSFPMNQLFASDGYSIGASASVLPMKVQHWFPIGLTDLVSLLFKGLSGVFFSTIIQKYQFFSAHSAFFMVQLSHPYMTTGKTIALIIGTFVSKVISLLFNMLFRFVIAFFLRSKHLLISWLQSPPTDFGAQENKICNCFHFFPFYLSWSDRTRCHDLRFLNVEFQASFFTLLFHFHQEAFQVLYNFSH